MKRLIPTDIDTSNEDFPDFMHNLMLNIEDSFLQANAKPREDYTYLDLMGFAIEIYKVQTPEVISFNKSTKPIK